MHTRILLVLILIAVLMGSSPAIQASQDDSIVKAWDVVNAHGNVTIQNAHETRIVWNDGTLKITWRDFADGSQLLAIRWNGQLVARHLLPAGWVTVCLDGQWQAYLLIIWCEDNPAHPDCA